MDLQERLSIIAFVAAFAATGAGLAAVWPILAAHFTFVIGALAVQMALTIAMIVGLWVRARKNKPVRPVEILGLGLLVLASWSQSMVVLMMISRPALG